MYDIVISWPEPSGIEMATTKKKQSSRSSAALDEQDASKVVSVRFGGTVLSEIEAAAARRRLPLSTFIKQCVYEVIGPPKRRK